MGAKTLLLSVSSAAIMMLLAGCGEPKATVTKSESEMIHAPLGQPMPPEARAAMEKANNRRSAGAVGVPPAAAPR